MAKKPAEFFVNVKLHGINVRVEDRLY